MSTFDVLLVDLQDLGCRIYTFVTTLLYVLEEAARLGKTVWVLDRPNPIGRPIEGTALRPGWQSFVGAAPMPMRHGLTLGEIGRWFVAHGKLDVDYDVVTMRGWAPLSQPGFGWPLDRAHVDQPEPERAEPVDGPLLSGHGHAGRHHVVRGARHHPTARGVRRPGPRHPCASCARCSDWRPTG